MAFPLHGTRYELSIDGLSLPLCKYSSARPRKHTVLLLHGGNTSSRMYAEPNGGLIRYLTSGSCEVWTLDWRGSALVVEPLVNQRGPLQGDEQRERELFSLDRIAEKDLPAALNEMRLQGVQGDISVLGFCLGGGVLSMAVARGTLESLGVGNVILVTLGLFYEVPWNGWIKAEDYLVERSLIRNPNLRRVSPARTEEWPAELAEAYERWPRSWLGGNRDEPIDELFRRLTFMYGEPYARGRLTRELELTLADGYFGSVHLGIYLHASQQVRRGYAARYNELDVIDRSRLSSRRARPPVVQGDLLPRCFRNKRVTVITGADDRIWHRDSVDLMYEWLRNHATPSLQRERHRKHVLPRYGHLDLFWSEQAEHETYPLFKAAIEQPALAGAASPSPRPAALGGDERISPSVDASCSGVRASPL